MHPSPGRKAIRTHNARSRPIDSSGKEERPTVDNLSQSVFLPYPSQPIINPVQPADRRYDTDFLTLQSLVKSNALGRIVEFESHIDRYKPTFANAKPWKTIRQPGGGAIYDIGAHLIDQIVLLFGLPQRITGFTGSQRAENAGGYDDSCTVLMHYADGMMATVKVAVVSPEEKQLRFWVRGERGSYKKVCSTLRLELCNWCVLTLCATSMTKIPKKHILPPASGLVTLVSASKQKIIMVIYPLSLETGFAPEDLHAC